ncbi:MAG: HD domain-containing protein [Dehalococcoidia bacterium]
MQTKTNLFVESSVVSILTRLQPFSASRNIRPFLVGGYVRDAICGKMSHDIDLVISHDVIDTARAAADFLSGRFVLLDELHQVARVVLMQNDQRWYIDFAASRGSIEEDLRERDFTIDAIAIELAELEAGWNQVECIDPLDGIGDLERKLIRAASESIFHDDPARLLRSFRLAAEFGFSIEPQTETLIERDSELITRVSGERIREELGRILQTDQATPSLRQMDRLGFLDSLIPELSVCRGVEQPKEHFWDVFDHSIETVAATERLLAALKSGDELLDSFAFSAELAEHFEQKAGGGLTRKALLKLAALLHDVAKPQTKSFDEEKGKMRFLGHAQQGAAIAGTIMERFRFSSREKEMVTRIIDQHLRPGHLSNAPEPPTSRAIYRYFRDNSDTGIDILFLSLADHLATRGPSFEWEGWQEHVEVTRQMLAGWFDEEAVISPPKLIDGHILIEKLGISPGPEIGRLLETVREAQASGEINTEEDALDFARKEFDKKHANQR